MRPGPVGGYQEVTVSRYYLSVDMKTGEPKVGKRNPPATFGVAVFTMELDIPDGWTKPVGTISLQLPGPPDESIVRIRDALNLDGDDDGQE